MNEKVVFIIGAGASKEAGLPTSDELINKIINHLDFDFDPFYNINKGNKIIFQALKNICSSNAELEEYVETGLFIKNNLPLGKSIDNFIDNHRENKKIALLGKLAIIQSILEAENNSTLNIKNKIQDDSLDLLRLKKAWYIPFYKIITENCNKDDLKDRFKNIILIIFNYDRCVEHFLFYSIRSYYNLSVNETTEIIKNIKIYHPYGFVGPLPGFEQNNIPFGAKPNPEKLFELTDQIKTFTEEVLSADSDYLDIRKSISTARKIVYLGFGFIDRNLEIIKPIAKISKNYPDIYASAYGFSVADRNEIKEKIKKSYGLSKLQIGFPEICFSDKEHKCYDFFQEFKLGLIY